MLITYYFLKSFITMLAREQPKTVPTTSVALRKLRLACRRSRRASDSNLPSCIRQVWRI